MAGDLSRTPTVEPLTRVCGRTTPCPPPTKQQSSYLSILRKSWPKDLGQNKNKTDRYRSGFLNLPPEIHILIASFLSPPSLLIISLTPNHRLHDLYRFHSGQKIPYHTILTGQEQALSQELYTRDLWRLYARSIIWKKALHRRIKLTVKEKDILRETQFFCYGCGVLVGYRHFPLSELWAALHRGGEDTMLRRRCWGEVESLKLFDGESMRWKDLEKWKDLCLSVDKLGYEAKQKRASTDAATAATTNGNTVSTNVNGNVNHSNPFSITFRPHKYIAEKAKWRPERWLKIWSTPSIELRNASPLGPYKPPIVQTQIKDYWVLVPPHSIDSFPRKIAHSTLVRALFVRRPYFCPHLDWRALLKTRNTDDSLEYAYAEDCKNMLEYMVQGINDTSNEWEDRVVEGRKVRQRVKGVDFQCRVRGCKTGVTVERVREEKYEEEKRRRIRVPKGVRESWAMRANASTTISATATENGSASGRANSSRVGDATGEWKETVWIVVHRTFRVTKPNGREWWSQIGLRK